ncbi:hypothetical protein F4823DRAFT_637661 [Ustulina deusta]|nr:hypothetical protein F4823DRAFT_637661 [Ustulina deusta]
MTGFWDTSPEIRTVSPSVHSLSSFLEDHASVDAEDEGANRSRENLSQGETHQAEIQDQQERISIQSPLTINILNTGGSNTGGSSTSGTGLPATACGSHIGGSNDLVSALAGQLADLSNKVHQLLLEPRPIVQSGTWNTSDARSWREPQEATEGRVNFLRQFKSKTRNFRVRAYATDIDVMGFTIHADSWSDTQIYSCGVSWIAIGD